MTASPIRVGLVGATGRMGIAIARCAATDPAVQVTGAWVRPMHPRLGLDLGDLAGLGTMGLEVSSHEAAQSSLVDVVIDFSAPEGLEVAISFCQREGVPLVTGTTGFDEALDAALDAVSERVAVVAAPNMSVGVALLFHLSELATRLAGPSFDAEIVEMHHRSKVDAPSGTAIRLAERVAEARGLSIAEAAVHGRSGAVGPRAEDEIGVMSLRGGGVVGEHTLLLAGNAERLELTHRAQDRSIFAAGALRAARWVVGAEAGRYGMEHVLGLAGAVSAR